VGLKGIQTFEPGMQQTSTLIPATRSASDLDHALAKETASGVMTSFGTLYERHNKRVYALCLRMTADPAEAEDLTHEVFLQVLRTIGAFRGDSQFTTWLYRLTVNQVLMHFRKASTRREALRLDYENELVSNIPIFAGAKGIPMVDRIGLKTAVASLPVGCRSVFLLFDVEGYKHEQIADMFGCSVGNSKSQLHKARKKLRLILQTT
jgi:RNA polymerase sigma-70 factor (ECF subfamily)